MHPRILGERSAAAERQIHASAAALADRFGLQEHAASLRQARDRDPSVSLLLQREATAALLGALDQATLDAAPAPAPERGRAPKSRQR